MTDLANTAFLRACRGEPGDRVPVWFMRQAGRSLPEYREIRGEGSILRAIATPDLATEITLQPVRRYGVDAAILYSDIVTPIHAIGFGIDIVPGTGPVATEPFRTSDDLARLRPLDPEADTPYVIETVRQLVAELDVPLIGFAGAPFTIASYLIEGRPSRTYTLTKTMMLNEPVLWAALLDRIADIVIASLHSQIDAGASAIQLFDSWAGSLTEAHYRQRVMPATEKIFAAVADTGVPRIHFGVNTGHLLPAMREAGADVVGVDWRTPLDRARQLLGPDARLQGNLDPAVCLAEWDKLRGETHAVLAANGGHPGHVFNLGHGVTPDLDPGRLKQVVDYVHEVGRTDGTVTPYEQAAS